MEINGEEVQIDFDAGGKPILPEPKMLAKNENMLAWDKYLQYLVEWAGSHKEYVYAGASPAGFDEWHGNVSEANSSVTVTP